MTSDAVAQTRSHNRQNEVSSVSGATTPTYDANGHLTRDETGKQLVYDAWGRPVQVKDSAGVTTDLYYSAAWQVLEVRSGGQARMQYIWSPVAARARPRYASLTSWPCPLSALSIFIEPLHRAGTFDATLKLQPAIRAVPHTRSSRWEQEPRHEPTSPLTTDR